MFDFKKQDLELYGYDDPDSDEGSYDGADASDY